MAALVTLEVAKRHLRIDPVINGDDEDVELKSAQASDIILGYLHGRRVVVSGITASGAVATVTTNGAHGVTSADVVSLFGSDQPEYNGFFVATVTSSTVFTIPITGTPDSPATGILGLLAPQSWTDATVPLRVQSAILIVLAHLWTNRGDADLGLDEALWTAIDRILARDRDPAMA